MEFELSFEINLENTFCESSFIVVHTTKRKSNPSVKRLDFQLSKIKTTFNRKTSTRRRKLSFNFESANPTFTNVIQSNDKLSKKTTFIKNSTKRTTASYINVIFKLIKYLIINLIFNF